MGDVLVNALIERFDRPDVKAIAVMGSYARGDAGPYKLMSKIKPVFRTNPSEDFIECLR